MSKFTVAMKRFGGFMKRNAFYFLIILCIASVATVIALAVTRNSANTQTPDMSVGDDVQTGRPENPTPPVDDDPPTDVNEPITFKMPCNGTATKDYAAKMVWSQTLKQYATHTGIDFTSEDLNVFASADGVVQKTGYDKLNGHYIVIEHKDGYVTKYMSLENTDSVKEGETVKQGRLIGKMSNSQGRESGEGAHLHFEIYKDSVIMDPLEALMLEEK